MIVAFAGQKGGAGKSTTAICAACEFLEQGRSVLLVDADPQQTANTWASVATEARHKAPTVIAMGGTMHRDGQLAKVAAPFDVTLIDCPPRHDAIQRSALMVADVVLLPCGPTAADVWALASTIELLGEARTVRAQLRAAVVLTRVQAHTSIGKSAREVLAETGLPVFKAQLGYRVAYQEALAAGLGVTTYAPRDVASDEVRALVEELKRFAKTSHLKLVAGAARG
jgi:chromosome partitioning protein